MKDWVKLSIRRILQQWGFEIRRTASSGLGHSFNHTFERLKVMRDLGFVPCTICDVGAADGRWTRECLEVFPESQYFCVEPLDEHQPYLARLNAEHPNISYWQGCLGSRTGKTILNVDGDGSSVLPGHWGNPYGTQREVTVETLDNLVLRGLCAPPDLIKLDVQGYELEVLKGATRALNKTEAIIAEVSFFSFQTGMPLVHEVVKQLAEYGFVVYDMLGLTLRPLDGAVGQADLLFLREEHPLRSSNKWAIDSIY